MSYKDKKLLTEKLGNNAFAWDERTTKYGSSPTLTIPSLIQGSIDNVRIGEDIAFEEVEDGELRSCIGLENFVCIPIRKEASDIGLQAVNSAGLGERNCLRQTENSTMIAKETSFSLPNSFGTFSTKSTEKTVSEKIPEIVIFDNHNHALYFWIDAVRRGMISPGFELIHIDEHSDLWDNSHTLDLDKALLDEGYSWEYTNLSCNVGNYILPAIDSGLVENMIRIENEYQIDTYMDYVPSSNSVLNLDLDIFAPELDHIPQEKKIKIIKNLIEKVQYVTIATSPFFIEQSVAIDYLQKILAKE